MRFRNLVFLASIATLLALPASQMHLHAASGAADNGAQTPAPVKAADPDALGSESYAKHCAICHGDQREGVLPGVPPLVSVKDQMTDQQITDLIREGKGRMPGFPKLHEDELAGLLHYLANALLGHGQPYARFEWHKRGPVTTPGHAASSRSTPTRASWRGAS